MGSTVLFEDRIGEVFDPEAQASHAEFLEDLYLRFTERSWLALKGDLLGPIPGYMAVQAVHQRLQLLDR